MSEFTDDPLEAVTQDNIDISLHIGPEEQFERRDVPGSDKPRVAPTDGAREYDIIQAEMEMSNVTDETNYIEAIVVGTDHNIPPSEGNPLRRQDRPEIVTLDVKNQLTEAERDGQQIDRIFTGVVANAARLGDHRFKMTVFWPGFNQIKDGRVITSPPPPISRFLNGTGLSFREIDNSFRKNKISTIINRVGRRVTRNSMFDYEVNLADDGVVVGETPDGQEIRNGFDQEITRDSFNEEIDSVLDDLMLKSESVWNVDRYGDFYFGAIQPDVHKLRYMTETSAGKQSPAWRSVRVIGDGVVSQDGWGASAQINESPEEVLGNIDGTTVEDGLAEPTFEYRNMEINTREEARHVMNELREEIRDQAAGGHIEVVGHPEMWPGDAIELPDAESQPFGLERFGVRRVIHRINNQEGFMTRIECGGLTNGVSTLFEDNLEDLIVEQREYENTVDRHIGRDGGTGGVSGL